MDEKEIVKMWEKNVLCDNCPFHAECADSHKDYECSTFIPDVFYKMKNHLYDTAKNWVDFMWEQVLKDKTIGTMHDRHRGVIAVFNMENPFEHGMAVCGKDDAYDGKVGIAIAYARYLGVGVHPDFESSKDREGE